MNIYDLISRAQKLRQETKLDSVSPDRVGALCEDTLKYINEFQLLASSPSLHKIYASVSAMQADKSPKSDLTGKALKPGQLVVIVPANQSDATAGDVYRYDGPSGNTSAWTFVSKIGAVATDAELNATSANPVQNKVVTEKLTELRQEVGHFDTPIDLHDDFPTGKKYVSFQNGELYDSGVCSVVICDVSRYVGRTLHFSRVRIPATDGLQGMAFFDAGGNYLSGQRGVLNASVWGIELSSLEIPNGAALAKLSCPTSELDNFRCYVYQNAKDAIDLLEAKVGDFIKETIRYGTPAAGKYIKYDDGQLLDSGVNSAITGIDVSKLVGKTLYYSKARIPSMYGLQGIAFYGQRGYISGVQGTLNAASWGVELASVVVPEGALTASFTCPTSSLSEFQLYYHQKVSESIGELKKLSEHLGDYIQNNQNILDRDTASRTITHNGITYTFDGDKWNVSGTATAVSWAEILGTSLMIPDGLEAGKLVKVKYSGKDVALHIVQYDRSGAVIQSTMFYSDAIVAIDANAKGVVVRLRVAANVTLDEDVTPVIINHLDEIDVSKELYSLQKSSDGSAREEKIVQCAKSYYVMTRANGYTYGERSALYYGDGGPLDQVHCGGLTALLASGCPFYSSRYVHPDSVNESFAAGYGFDFEAYSLRLAQSGVQSEIDYIGAENVNKSVAELKKLMKFKTSYKLSTSCLRWNMIRYIQNGGNIDFSQVKIGDILFYGVADDGQPKMIDGELVTPVLIEGNRIMHCDTVIDIKDGVPYVIDAGAAPISIHAFSLGTYYTYVCVGRVPLFDIVM